jgi:Antitoxin ParD
VRSRTPSGIARPSQLAKEKTKAAALVVGTRRLAIDLPETFHRKLKVLAASEGTTVKAYVMDLLERAMTSSRSKAQP